MPNNRSHYRISISWLYLDPVLFSRVCASQALQSMVDSEEGLPGFKFTVTIVLSAHKSCFSSSCMLLPSYLYTSGSLPQKNILGYPEISWDILRYPHYRISQGYLGRISKDTILDMNGYLSWIQKDIHFISIDIQLLSTDLSCSLSFHIQSPPCISIDIHRYPLISTKISFYLSWHIHQLIQWYPLTYPIRYPLISILVSN